MSRAWLLAWAAALGAACAACAAAPALDPSRPVRIAVRASESTREISTLSYKGGFETKTLLYETLVKRGPDGRIAPALAQSWRFEQDGRQCVMELRRNARFHDGAPVTAEAVREHFQRWVGLPEHDWLACNRHILAVRAEGPGTLRIVTDEPLALLPDLCAINPCAIRAPSTLDFEGNFVKPVGSGPFAWDGSDEDGKVLHYTLRQRPGKDGLALSRIDLGRFVNEGPDVPVDELLAGRLDLVADSWRERIPRERLAALRADSRVTVLESAGSSVISLGFRTEGGPCASQALRALVRGALRRSELIGRAELGCADECFAFAAPSVRAWPAGLKTFEATRPQPPAAGPALRLLAR
ncbi:MAG TPA: ABC transporter substrate-binding protein, partial [Planctomycetota bacterium]|nr:ABC transporter substrate-binding protein [Planctomycetota bacterium]